MLVVLKKKDYRSAVCIPNWLGHVIGMSPFLCMEAVARACKMSIERG
jgi:hypothetical protein